MCPATTEWRRHQRDRALAPGRAFRRKFRPGVDTGDTVFYIGETRLTRFLGLGAALLGKALSKLHASPQGSRPVPQGSLDDDENGG